MVRHFGWDIVIRVKLAVFGEYIPPSGRLKDHPYAAECSRDTGTGMESSGPAAVASWRPSVPRNGHRGSPSVQLQATHYVLLVRQRLGPLARPPRARRRLLRALQAQLASPGRPLRV